MHRGPRRNPFQICYVVSPEEFFSIDPWFTQKRFSDWVRVFPRSHHGSRRNVFQIGYAVSPAELSSIASWLTQKCLSDWLRGLTCRDFLDRIVAHAQTSFRLVAPPHLQSFPRSHRGSRSRRNVAQISYVVSTVIFHVVQSFSSIKQYSTDQVT